MASNANDMCSCITDVQSAIQLPASSSITAASQIGPQHACIAGKEGATHMQQVITATLSEAA